MLQREGWSNAAELGLWIENSVYMHNMVSNKKKWALENGYGIILLIVILENFYHINCIDN